MNPDIMKEKESIEISITRTIYFILKVRKANVKFRAGKASKVVYMF